MKMKSRGIFFVALVVVFALFGSLHAAEPLPDTGQTKFYNNTIEIIGTPPAQGEAFYGQDAHYPRDRAYTKLNAAGSEWHEGDPQWVMVRDNVTSLIWEAKTDDGSIHDRDNIYDWYEAQSVFIASLNADGFGGSDKWRLPTYKELSWIIDAGPDNYPYPSINIEFFPQTKTRFYWSSTTRAGDTNYVWLGDFGSGYIQQYFPKTNSHSVRAVRSGQ